MAEPVPESKSWTDRLGKSVVWFALGMIATGVIGAFGLLTALDGHIEGQIKNSEAVRRIGLTVEEAGRKLALANVMVFAECSGGFQKCTDPVANTAKCPAGKTVRSGIWHYSAPDTVPHGNNASWLMCFNLSGKCPAGEDHCSITRPAANGDTGCSRPNFEHEVGIVVADCS
jgi:hypothetical protein